MAGLFSQNDMLSSGTINALWAASCPELISLPMKTVVLFSTLNDIAGPAVNDDNALDGQWVGFVRTANAVELRVLERNDGGWQHFPLTWNNDVPAADRNRDPQTLTVESPDLLPTWTCQALLVQKHNRTLVENMLKCVEILSWFPVLRDLAGEVAVLRRCLADGWVRSRMLMEAIHDLGECLRRINGNEGVEWNPGWRLPTCKDLACAANQLKDGIGGTLIPIPPQINAQNNRPRSDWDILKCHLNELTTVFEVAVLTPIGADWTNPDNWQGKTHVLFTAKPFDRDDNHE